MALKILAAALGVASGAWVWFALSGAGARSGPGDRGARMEASDVRYSRSGFDITPLSDGRVAELAEKLTPEQRGVILAKGTERPFCGTLLDNKKTGVYVCALCDLPLFDSGDKFHSGTGWPSFFQPVDPDHVVETRDTSHGMTRVEITCARCGGHLGHVFEDGPEPTGLRFCVNSESLTFYEEGNELPQGAMPVQRETAYFAGGCFWGVEHHFQQIDGVVDAVSGFQGGRVKNPTYEQVCRADTGFAETVKVTYDPSRVTYRQLLRAFFAMHDPTQLDRQGPDVGDQYRGAIFAADQSQLTEAEAYIETLRGAEVYDRPIVTQVVPAEGHEFYPAEAYHQDYVARTGRACHAMRPLSELPE